MNVNIIKKANDIVKRAEEGYVAVIDKEGYPHSATRSVRNADGIFSCYFTTNKGGNMANAIEQNSKGSVCFREKNSNVTLVGDFEVITDSDIKKEVWVDWFINHYPGGAEDPNYFVTRFNTNHVSLWIDRQYFSFEIEMINKPQSYCGLLCAGCSYRESDGCKQCIPTGGKPFYGDCPIAECAKSRGYMHCGQCPDMPCEKLYEYSCGEGDNCDRPKGARLEILEYWNANA